MAGMTAAAARPEAARDDVAFVSGEDRCAAWAYPPAAGVPDLGITVVMAHGLAAVKEMRLDAYAERFAAIGCAVLVFDYRHFGSSGGQPRQLLDVGRQHADWTAAVAYARGRFGEDRRLVLWGSSLSGGHVLALAGRVGADAVISQVPHVSGVASVGAISPRQVLRLTLHGAIDLLGAALGRGPHYIPAAGAPGDLALMTAPEALEYLDLVPEGGTFENRVAARFAVLVGLYSPGRALKGVRVPVLVQVAEHDATTPPSPARALAGQGDHVRVRTYPLGHFQPYTGEPFEEVVAEQVAFLRDVAAGPAAGTD